MMEASGTSPGRRRETVPGSWTATVTGPGGTGVELKFCDLGKKTVGTTTTTMLYHTLGNTRQMLLGLSLHLPASVFRRLRPVCDCEQKQRGFRRDLFMSLLLPPCRHPVLNIVNIQLKSAYSFMRTHQGPPWRFTAPTAPARRCLARSSK